MTTPLFIEHLFNATTYGVYHVEIHHCTTKTLISEMTLRSSGFQSLLQSTRNKTTTICIVKPSEIFYKIDALL